jgi:hypothetical protein
MQRPPAPPEPANPPFRGCDRERDERQEREHSDRDVLVLDDVLDDVRHHELHVEVEISGEMDTSVEEHEQPEHPAVADEGVPAEESSQGCHRERRRENAQRPAAGLLLELLVRRGTEVRMQRSPDQPGEWQQADDEHHRLGDEIDPGRATSRCRLSARRRGRRWFGDDATRSGQ